MTKYETLQIRPSVLDDMAVSLACFDNNADKKNTSSSTARFSPFPDMVLPPFLGEFGVEVRFFLGFIEPWLRSGYKIFARRPELYPDGSAVYNENLFRVIDDIMRDHDMVPCGAGIRHLSHRWNEAPVDIDINSNGDNRWSISSSQWVGESCECNRRLFSLLYSICDLSKRKFNFADEFLLRFQNGWDSRAYSAVAILPTYKPPHFLAKSDDVTFPHIGCQMRTMRTKKGQGVSARDSSVPQMQEYASVLSSFFSLPIIFYGHPDGCFLPYDSGSQSTASIAAASGRTLLATELTLLADCKVMLSPDSGWADLMVWLQVPTLLEKLINPGSFSDVQIFNPRLSVIRDNADIVSQAEAVIGSRSCVPETQSSRRISAFGLTPREQLFLDGIAGVK